MGQMCDRQCSSEELQYEEGEFSNECPEEGIRVSEKEALSYKRLNEMKRQYWTVPRVVFTYVTARVFYDILKVVWRGPGRYVMYVVVGSVLVSLLK